MTTRYPASNTNFSIFFIVSIILHLAVLLLMIWWTKLFPFQMTIQEAYYVDVVNLPVAAPRSGSPTQKGNDNEAPTPPPRPAVPENMAVPAPPQKSTRTTKQLPAVKSHEKTSTPAEPDEFAERMAKLAGKAESQQQEAALERIRRKMTTSGSGRSGMPGASGNEAGSSYSAYIQSRLKDAFRETISYTSKQPEVLIRLVIGADGRISRKKIEQSSGDRSFELAALRAIDIASEKFPPPPGHRDFEGVFVFRPQGISNGGKL
ncbi:energy transducer TonB [Pelotalea chapellei]|uniref:Cell envelope integrity protein TolA n=1 Tax=Pelotalea chapellei TaxID=44671 RepID=A0ABS5U514_9BACT|nr:TonB family protein [Pelotalea chapellei]MBT1070756.1 cell envelope integrity protein TolA [Pelotalea chapellei]